MGIGSWWGFPEGKIALPPPSPLTRRRKRVPTHYELIPVHIDLGFDSEPASVLKELFEAEGFSYHIEFTDIGKSANSS